MADTELKVRITGDLTAIRNSLKGLEQQLVQLSSKANTAGQRAGQGLGQLERVTGRITSAITGFAAAFVSLQGLRTFVVLSDQAARLDARLKLATKSQEEFNRAQRGTFEIAQRTRTSLESTIELYSRLERSTRDLQLNQATLLQLTETINQTGQLSGGGPGVEAGLVQLAQGLQSGKLAGDELRSVLEQIPRLSQAIQDGLKELGVEGSKDLRKLAEEGVLTPQLTLRALLTQVDEVEAEFKVLPLSISGAFTQIQNSLLGLVRDSNEATGAQRDLAEAVSSLTKTIEDPSTLEAFNTLGAAIARLTGFAIEGGREFANFGKIIGRELARLTGGLTEADALTAEIEDVDRALNNSFFGRPAKYTDFLGRLNQTPEQLRALREKLVRERDALLAEQGFGQGGGAPAGPAEEVGVPETTGVGSRVADLTKKLNEQAAAYGLAKSQALELERAKELAAATNDDERKAINGAYDALIAKVQAEERAASASKNRGDAIANQVRDATLLRDTIERTTAELQRLYEAGEIGLRDFFSERARLQQQAIDAQIAQAQAELSVATSLEQQANILARIEILQRDRAEIGPATAREQAAAEEQLARRLEDVQARLAELQGDTTAGARLALERERDELLRAFQDNPEASALVNQVFDIELARSRANAIRDEAARLTADLRAREENAAIQMDAGTLGQVEGEKQVQDARAQTIQQLEALRLKLLEVLATNPSDPEALNALRELDGEIARVKASADTFRNQVKDVGQSSLSTFFTDLATGAKSFKDAFKDMVVSFVQGIAKMIAQELALRAVRAASNFFGSTSVGVNHGGGMAGAGMKRVIPAAMAAALFAGAPRFHDGGIAGLKPGEVPAILQTGERVLSRSETAQYSGGDRPGPGYRIINAFDPSFVPDQMDSADGERVILNLIGRNPGRVNQLLGR